MSETKTAKRGRPSKGEKPMSASQRAAAYRARQDAAIADLQNRHFFISRALVEAMDALAKADAQRAHGLEGLHQAALVDARKVVQRDADNLADEIRSNENGSAA